MPWNQPEADVLHLDTQQPRITNFDISQMLWTEYTTSGKTGNMPISIFEMTAELQSVNKN